MKKHLIRLTEKDLHNIIKNVIKEAIDDEEVTNDKLLDFIKNSGDFLYYFNGKFHAANSDEIVNEIYDDVIRFGATPTHILDKEIEYNWNKFFGNSTVKVITFEVHDKHGKYYIIYTKDL